MAESAICQIVNNIFPFLDPVLYSEFDAIEAQLNTLEHVR